MRGFAYSYLCAHKQRTDKKAKTKTMNNYHDETNPHTCESVKPTTKIHMWPCEKRVFVVATHTFLCICGSYKKVAQSRIHKVKCVNTSVSAFWYKKRAHL
eukprot:GEMP01082017.1.p3 GENE.GEMP01082017.1~~GEMP01082017.1.p3  ORF type:complete len:100 (+),score=5.85 GEMP01082017.1:94-393(+)